MGSTTGSLEDKLSALYDSCTPEEQGTLAAMFVMAAATGADDAPEPEVEGFSAAGFEGGGGIEFDPGGGLGRLAITPIPIPAGFDPGGGILPNPHRINANKVGASMLSRIR